MSHIEELVAKQLELCELRRRLEPEELRTRPPPGNGTTFGRCLVISRECGSGGSRLARIVGERLGWQVFNREIVEEVARCAHVRQQLIKSVDERVRSGWREWRRRFIEGEGVGRESYLTHLREVILALGHHGNVVIVGRGANYILPLETVVSVRVVAPLDERARRVAARDGISEDKARRLVERTDTERAAFIREVFAREVGACASYDLIVNTGELSLEAATDLVLAKLERKLHVTAEPMPCAP